MWATIMTEIESDVPMPADSPKLPRKVAEAMADYKAAYKAVFGVYPLEPKYENGYILIEGHCGVTLSIFKRRIKQLTYRG